ncbi:hypothetical protein HKX48_005825 [Thoreauomyces humboldtii]|nr:hypothetical protein HKX48_005825 [Thoreauomyces humboldtii]
MKRSAKLSFKGDPGVVVDKKKRKKRKATDAAGGEDGVVTTGSSSSSRDGWVAVEHLDDLKGPIMILTSATEPPSILTCSETTSKVSFVPLPEDKTISSYEPESVAQVFVAKSLPDSSKASFRSSFDRYLGTDKFGVVACEREAMGPSEEWQLLVREDGAALQTSFDKFLRCDDQSAARADADAVGFREVFQIRCQAVNKIKGKKAKQDKALDTQEMELEQMKRSQSWGGGRLVFSQEDTRELRQAKKDGLLNEALLDRRAKLKSDKFCK